MTPPLSTSRNGFLADLETISRFGATGRGGVHREAGSPAHTALRDWLCERFDDLSLTTVVDPVGNLFGVKTWRPGAPAVLVGSHLDSQPTAGRLDGAYGVLAAVHAAERVLSQVGTGSLTPVFNLAVVDWFNEEGSRFFPSIMGSSVYSGLLDADVVLNTTDDAGISVAEALKIAGYLGTQSPPDPGAYVEIHIEQGHELDQSGAQIGLVTGNWATAKLRVEINGAQAHTASAMADRSDAMAGAGAVITAVHDLTAEYPTGSLIGTVGRLVSYPNVPGTVSSRVTLHVDMRSSDEHLLQHAVTTLTARVAEIMARYRLRAQCGPAKVRAGEPYSPTGVALAASTAADLALTARPLLTRAGHDSIALRRLVPTIMLFVPSKDGVSHNEAENTDEADLEAGVAMLSAVVARLVKGELNEVHR